MKGCRETQENVRRKEKSSRWEEKASYTVEASWIIAICMGILMFVILSGFELFYHTLEAVQKPGEEINCVRVFRMSEEIQGKEEEREEEAYFGGAV